MKTVVITGANSGLGFETAKKTAKNRDFRVILACRNMEKGKKAEEEIIRETGNENVAAMQLDTSSLESVRAFAKKVIAQEGKVDVLVNNAGIGGSAPSGLTEDGFDIVFATNHLGHFLLTLLLIPVMPDGAKIFSVSSDMHNPPGGIEWKGVEALAHPTEEDRNRYAASKLCNVYFIHELHRRLAAAGKKITANAFNPGFMADTNFTKGRGKEMEPRIRTQWPERIGDLAESSDALAKLVTEDTLAYISNAFFDRSTRAIFTSALSYNEENEKELWEASMRYTGIEEPAIK